MKLAWFAEIAEVGEKTLTVGGKRSVDGKAELMYETAGWYVRIGNVSLYVGNEKPPFNKGDRVKLILEHDVQENNSEENPG